MALQRDDGSRMTYEYVNGAGSIHIEHRSGKR